MTAEQRDRIRAQVVAARKAQGLPDHVQGPVLDRLAAEVLERAEEITGEAAA